MCFLVWKFPVFHFFQPGLSVFSGISKFPVWNWGDRHGHSEEVGSAHGYRRPSDAAGEPSKKQRKERNVENEPDRKKAKEPRYIENTRKKGFETFMKKKNKMNIEKNERNKDMKQTWEKKPKKWKETVRVDCVNRVDCVDWVHIA